MPVKPNYGRRVSSPPPGSTRAPYKADRRMLQARVTLEQHAKAHAAAEALGISVSALLAELVDRMKVDAQGQPAWESRYAHPSPTGAEDPMRLSA